MGGTLLTREGVTFLQQLGEYPRADPEELGEVGGIGEEGAGAPVRVTEP